MQSSSTFYFVLFESIKSRKHRIFSVHSILSTASNVHWLIHYSRSGQSAPFTIRPKSYVNWCAEHHFWDLLVCVEKFPSRTLVCWRTRGRWNQLESILISHSCISIKIGYCVYIVYIYIYFRIFSTLNGYIFGWAWSIFRITSERQSVS